VNALRARIAGGGRWAAAALLALGCGAARAGQAESPTHSEASPRALVANGEAAAAAGDATRAEQYFAAALQSGANAPRVMQRLLTACISDRRYPAAAHYADRYLLRHPEDSRVAFAAATLHLALGNLERARELLEALLEREPRWPEPHFALASLLRARGQAGPDAELHDRRYLALAPRGPLAELARARLQRTPEPPGKELESP
jgi:Tfp pilus assembly protein PilF